MIVVLFYDAPTPTGVFDDLLAIPAIEGNASTTTFSGFVESAGPLSAFNGLRFVV